MHHLPPLIHDLAIILAVASIVTLLFQKIRQPVVLGYLVAGAIVGPHTPPHAFITSFDNIRVLSELGVIFLMFSLGLEFSFHKLKRVGFSASITGGVEVIGMSLLGYGVGRLLGWSFYDSIFLGAALAISSTTIIIKALDELKLNHKQFAQIIFGVLIVEDLLAILLLVGLSTLVATQDVFSMGMLFAALKLILVVGGWFLLGYFLVPSLFRNIVHYASEETLTIVSIALCLVLVCAAAYFDYSVALGAFLMGSIIAETPVVHQLEKLVRPIRDIFAAIFFVAIGMLIDLKIIWQHLPVVLLLCFITIVGKIVITGTGALLAGRSVRTSLQVGFGMGQIGEFSFIIATLGLSLKVISANLYPIIVAVSAVTTFTTPYLIRLSMPVTQKVDKILPLRFHTILENYSLWLDRLGTNRKLKSAYRNAFLQLLINAIIVALIFSLVELRILPKLLDLTTHDWLLKIAGWLIAIILSCSFIWGMWVAFRGKIENKIISQVMLYVSRIIAVSEVAVLSINYFDNWKVTLAVLILTIISFRLVYKKLDQSYHWLENNLMRNVRSHNHANHPRYEELAPWDTHLVEIDVGRYSPLVYKSLKDHHLRERFGVNIVAIYRDTNIILSPRGEQRIEPFDKLIVLGNDEQIEQFKSEMIRDIPPEQTANLLENFSLKLIAVNKDDNFVGNSIRESGIREKTHGIVAGLERRGKRILNPNPDIKLEEGDLLFVVGETEKINQFK